MLKFTFLKRIYRRIRRKIAWVRRVLKCARLLKDYQDYDSGFALDVFCDLLLGVADYLEKYGNAVDAEHNACRIRLAVKLLLDSYYERKTDQAWDKLEEDHGPYELHYIPIEDKKKEGIQVYEIEATLGGKSTDDEQIRKIIDSYIVPAREWEEKAWYLGWKIVSQDLRKWWD